MLKFLPTLIGGSQARHVMRAKSLMIVCGVLVGILTGSSPARAELEFTRSDVPKEIRDALEAKLGKGNEKAILKCYHDICTGLSNRLTHETKILLGKGMRELVASGFVNQPKITEFVKYRITWDGAHRKYLLDGGLSDSALYKNEAELLAKHPVVRAEFEKLSATVGQETEKLTMAELKALGGEALLKLNFIIDLWTIASVTQEAIDACQAEYEAEMRSLGDAAQLEAFNQLVRLLMDRLHSGELKLRSGAQLSQAIKMLAENLRANRPPYKGMINRPGVDTAGANPRAVFDQVKTTNLAPGVTEFKGTWLSSGQWKWVITKEGSGYKVQQTTDPGKKTVASVTFDGTDATITFSDTGYAGTITWKPGKSDKAILIFTRKPDDSPQVIGKKNEVSMVKQP